MRTMTRCPTPPRLPSLLAFALAAAAAACNTKTPDEKVAGGDTRPAPPPPAPGDTACPLYGNWQPCSIAERLERTGLAPRLQPDTLRDEAFGVRGYRWLINDATLDVFVYATPAARERATAALDSAAVVRTRSRLAPPPKDATPLAPGKPAGQRESHFVRTANIAVILANATGVQAERILLAITAGQPAR